MLKNELKQGFLKSTGNVICRKRRHKNITQEELGKELGVSASTISRYEKGILDMPVSNLPLISNYCDFKMRDYLIEWEAIDVKSYAKKALTCDNITPDQEIIEEFVNSFSERDLADFEEICRCIDVLQNNTYQQVIIDTIIKKHMESLDDSEYVRLMAYYRGFQEINIRRGNIL